MRRTQSKDARPDDPLPVSALRLISRMRQRGRLNVEELSVKGRLQLMEYDARARQTESLEERNHEENQSIHQEANR
jgi:hypothetical protein